MLGVPGAILHPEEVQGADLLAGMREAAAQPAEIRAQDPAAAEKTRGDDKSTRLTPFLFFPRMTFYTRE